MTHSEESWKHIFEIARAMQDALDKPVGRPTSGLTLAQQRVLSVIFEHGKGGIMLHKISKALNQRTPTTSVAIAALVKKGMVESCRNEENRRSVIIRLTQNGEEARLFNERYFTGMMENLLKEISEADRQTFSDVLAAIARKLPSANDMNSEEAL